MPWATHVLQWPVQREAKPRGGANLKSRSQFGLQAATRLHEVGIASNRESERRGECVPGPCTHRPSHHESWQHPKPVSQPGTQVVGKDFRRWLLKESRKHLRSEFSPVECREAAVEGGAGDWGEVVTRYPYRKVRMDHLLSKEQRSGGKNRRRQF